MASSFRLQCAESDLFLLPCITVFFFSNVSVCHCSCRFAVIVFLGVAAASVAAGVAVVAAVVGVVCCRSRCSSFCIGGIAVVLILTALFSMPRPIFFDHLIQGSHSIKPCTWTFPKRPTGPTVV